MNVAWRPAPTNSVVVQARQASEAGEINSLESIPGPLNSLQIRALGTEALHVNGGTLHRLKRVGIECLSNGPFLACPMWWLGRARMAGEYKYWQKFPDTK
jgi:hypothetical protein